MTTGSTTSRPTYEAVLIPLSPTNPDDPAEVPALELMLCELRGFGWTGAAHVRPQVDGSTNALQSIVGTGLTPGSACRVEIARTGDWSDPLSGRRRWICIVTSVNAKEMCDSREAYCVIGFADLLTAYSSRPVWFAWSAVKPEATDPDAPTVLAELVGGALMAAIGEDPHPGSALTLPEGFPTVTIDADVESEVESPEYVIAAGQPFGTWLEQLCGHLGVRIELVVPASGEISIHLTDRPPAESHLNHLGPVEIVADSTKPPSSIHIRLTSYSQNAARPQRRSVLDTPNAGGPAGFGGGGVVGNVISDARLDIEEAERRSSFDTKSDELEALRIAGVSSQLQFTPGRLVEITGPELAMEDDGQSELKPGEMQWQVASVAHLYMRGSYWNRAEFLAADIPWRPRLRPAPGPVVVSGWIDDGESLPGEPVKRDSLGRVPVRLVFSEPFTKSSDGSTPSKEGGTTARYVPALQLTPISLIAGSSHGHVTDHRQQDWCRVQVHSPLSAEVLGFVYRDDRSIKPLARGLTAGMLVRQGAENWRGLAFRPMADIADMEGDSSPTEDGNSLVETGEGSTGS